MAKFKLTFLALLTATMICLIGFTLTPQIPIVNATQTPDILWMPLMDLSSVSIGPDNGTFPDSPLGEYDPPPYWEYLPVNVWIVADEEFRSKEYDTTYLQKLSWSDYAKNVVERSDDRLYEIFGIDLCIVAVSTWESDNSKYGDEILIDAISKTGFKAETRVNGNHINILIAFTGQYLGYVAGTYVSKRAIIMTATAYWADDNVLRHEVSHLFGCLDHEDSNDPCYFLDCIMSYRKVPVEYWMEDGWIWYVGCDVSLAAISNNWCSKCWSTIVWKKIYFLCPRCVGNQFYMMR